MSDGETDSTSSSFDRRSFLQTAGAAATLGPILAAGRASAGVSVTVYLYQNYPESEDSGSDIDEIFNEAWDGLTATMRDLSDHGLWDSYGVVNRSLDEYPRIDVSDNCDALSDFQAWLWNNGYREGSEQDPENAAHVLVRDSANAADGGGCASGGTTLWKNDHDTDAYADYDGDGVLETRESLARAIVGGDLDGSDDDPTGISDADEIQTAAAHEFSHLAVDGGSNTESDCWNETFDVNPQDSHEHAVGTYSGSKGELSIMSRYVSAAGADKEPCKNATDEYATGLWHSQCYVDLAFCERDFHL